MKQNKKEDYETPEMDVVEFELEDAIALSGDMASAGSFCGSEGF